MRLPSSCHQYGILALVTLLGGVQQVYSSPPPPSRTQKLLVRNYDFSKALNTWKLHNEPDELPNDKRFAKLSRAFALHARTLTKEGVTVGKLLDQNISHRDIVTFLLSRGVVDANAHFFATVHLMEEGNDATGYWCRLVSHDPYVTSQQYEKIYDFAIHIGKDGTIRMMHVNHVGNSESTPNK